MPWKAPAKPARPFLYIGTVPPPARSAGFVEPETRSAYAETFILIHTELSGGSLELNVTIPEFKQYRKVYQTKSGYWYCNLTSEKGCPERQALNLEGYQSKEDILRHMKSLRTDYCILRCSMEGFTV